MPKKKQTDESSDRWFNAHRTKKRIFTAYLPEDEQELISRAKFATGTKTDRELLVFLCEERLKLKNARNEVDVFA